MPEVAKVIDEVDSGVNIEIISELITERQMDILRCISRDAQISILRVS